MRSRKPKKITPTILMVVEGYADEAFIKYLKGHYHQRKSDFRLEIKNARGKGALNVVQYASRLNKQFSYSPIYVLFDTDKDWSVEAKRIVKDNNFIPLTCEPCLEAELLRILDEKVAESTDNIKKQFSEKIGCDAHKIESFEKVFPIKTIELSASKNNWIKNIVNVLSSGTI